MARKPAPSAYAYVRPSWTLLGWRWALKVLRPLPSQAGDLAFRLYFMPNLGRRRRHPKAFSHLAHESMELLIRGKRVQAYRLGQGPAVLMAHGWESHASRFTALAEAVVAKGFSAVVYDAPGHGASEGKTTSILEMMELIRMLEKKVGGFHALAGHSFGGVTLLRLLREGVQARALVLVAVPTSFQNLFHMFCGSLGVRGKVKSVFQDKVERFMATHSYDAWKDFSPLENASALNLPTLVVHDKEDAVLPFEQGKALAASHPAARLLATQGHGHNNVLRYADVTAAITDFLLEQREPGEPSG